MINKTKNIILISVLLVLYSCNTQWKLYSEINDDSKLFNLILENSKLGDYSGWWIYGEGQHIFKDEKTLSEWEIEFSKENSQEIKNLYMAVCEMEYFPMECKIIGYLKTDLTKNNTTLVVDSFEILYIQGCGE